MAASLWVCIRCSTAIRSDVTPSACYYDQGGCKRPADDTLFLGPFQESAKAALEIDAQYRKLRLTDGLPEPDALDALERIRDEPPEVLRTVLAQSCLLDEWPIGWRCDRMGDDESEWERLAKHMTFEDVTYWLRRLIDTPETDLLIAALLSAQGHLHPLLRAIGPAIHVISSGGRFSAGKSRVAEILTYLGGGEWYATASVPSLKRVRDKAPIIVGIDEGDEAEKMNPGVKAYLLASHDWGARYLRYADPDEKGKRSLETLLFGGPVFITFRAKPWPAILSRAFVLEMEPSQRYAVSDDGDGEGYRRLLGPARIWLARRCADALRDKNSDWAMKRTHEADFSARLDRVYKQSGATFLRRRGFARAFLLTAEVLGLDMDRIEQTLIGALAEQEVESENAVIIEAIEGDPLYNDAMTSGQPVPIEDLRLRTQKFLRDHREYVDLTRNRMASVLSEMGYSKAVGPTWKRVEMDGKQVTAILPALLKGGLQGVTGLLPLHMEKEQTLQTMQTTSEGHRERIAEREPKSPSRVYDENEAPVNPNPCRDKALRRAQNDALTADADPDADVDDVI